MTYQTMFQTLCSEKYRGESLPFESIIRRQAKEIAEYYEDGKRFRPYKAKW